MKKFCFYSLLLVSLIFIISCDKSSDEPFGGSNSNNNHKNHEWVDLGLPSGNKWAKANIGAVDTLDAGEHFTFGSVTSIEEHIKNGEYGMSYSPAQSVETDNSIAGTDLDVAHVKWKGNWRMPTKKDYEELFEQCEYRYTVIEEKGGYLFTGKNGNTLFLPNTGHYIGGTCDAIHNGYYWTATRVIELRFFKSKEIRLKSGDAGHGMAVRAICN